MAFRRIISSIVLFLLALSVWPVLLQGCAPRLGPEPEWEKDARAYIEQAEELYAKRQYAQAAATIDAFFTKYPKSRQADRAYYILGEIRLNQRDYRQALSYYKEIIERHPRSPLIAEAAFKLGKCYYELGEYDLAIDNLEDRRNITDTARLISISEMLSSAYLAKSNYAPALREFVFLSLNAPKEMQRAGYRERVRELIEKYLTEDELREVAQGEGYPADIAQLRLASLLLEQRRFRDAARASRNFLDRFPLHPEKTRGEMLLDEATSQLGSARWFLGALLPQSGQLAYYGDRVFKGLQLAVHTHNMLDVENTVQLIVSETEGTPDRAVAALNELASKGIIAGIGPLTTRAEEAIAPTLDIVGIPFIRPVATRSGFGVKTGWMLRNGVTIDSQAEAAARYAIGRELQKIVVLYPDDPYGKDLSRLFVKNIDRRAEILASVPYPPDTKDFGLYIRKAMEIDLRARKIEIPADNDERKKLYAEYSPGFDGLYLPGYAEKVGLLIPQLAYYNITDVAMIGSDNWYSPELIERAGRHAEGAVFVAGFFGESNDPTVKSFVDAYRSAYQEEPDILAAQAYDSAMLILSLIREGKDTPIAVRDGLLAVRDYPGVTGSTTFAGSNEAEKNLFLIKIENGRFKAAEFPRESSASVPANRALTPPAF